MINQIVMLGIESVGIDSVLLFVVDSLEGAGEWEHGFCEGSGILLTTGASSPFR